MFCPTLNACFDAISIQIVWTAHRDSCHIGNGWARRLAGSQGDDHKYSSHKIQDRAEKSKRAQDCFGPSFHRPPSQDHHTRQAQTQERSPRVIVVRQKEFLQAEGTGTDTMLLPGRSSYNGLLPKRACSGPITSEYRGPHSEVWV